MLQYLPGSAIDDVRTPRATTSSDYLIRSDESLEAEARKPAFLADLNAPRRQNPSRVNAQRLRDFIANSTVVRANDVQLSNQATFEDINETKVSGGDHWTHSRSRRETSL